MYICLVCEVLYRYRWVKFSLVAVPEFSEILVSFSNIRHAICFNSWKGGSFACLPREFYLFFKLSIRTQEKSPPSLAVYITWTVSSCFRRLYNSNIIWRTCNYCSIDKYVKVRFFPSILSDLETYYAQRKVFYIISAEAKFCAPDVFKQQTNTRQLYFLFFFPWYSTLQGVLLFYHKSFFCSKVPEILSN